MYTVHICVLLYRATAKITSAVASEVFLTLSVIKLNDLQSETIVLVVVVVVVIIIIIIIVVVDLGFNLV